MVSGSVRYRLPVSLANALATAGAINGTGQAERQLHVAQVTFDEAGLEDVASDGSLEPGIAQTRAADLQSELRPGEEPSHVLEKDRSGIEMKNRVGAQRTADTRAAVAR